MLVVVCGGSSPGWSYAANAWLIASKRSRNCCALGVVPAALRTRRSRFRHRIDVMADEPDLSAALADLHAVLGELGSGEDHLATEQYTDAVIRARV
jgi:hypothetical protein